VSCVEQMKYDLLLERVSFKEAKEYIEKHSDEVYYVEPGYKIFKDYYVIGVPPIAIGAKGDELVFTYVKPCHGTFVMKIKSEEEIQRLRDKEKEKVMKSLKSGTAGNVQPSEKPGDYRSVFK
jgi:hypothetical protein